MISVQVNDVTVDVAQLKGDARMGLATAVEVIHTRDRLVEDYLSMPGVNRYLLNNVPVPCHAYGVKISYPRACHVDVSIRVHVYKTGYERRSSVVHFSG